MSLAEISLQNTIEHSKMRLVLLFLFFSIFPPSNASLFGSFSEFVNQAIGTVTNLGNTVSNLGSSVNSVSDYLKNPKMIVDELKNKVDTTAIFKNIVDKIQQVVSIDKILNSLKEKMNTEQTINKIKKSINIQQIYNQIVKTVKQKANLQQLFKKIFSPLVNNAQQFFNQRSKFCDAVCEKWYNFPCFLVMNCEQKMNDFKQVITLPAVLLCAILACCCGGYIFFALSNCAKFLKCLLLLPIKVMLESLKKKYRYKNHQRLQSQQQDQQINKDSPPCPLNTEIGIEMALAEKILSKNSEHVEHEEYEIQPSPYAKA